MTDLERLMLAIYNATVKVSAPFADAKATFAVAALPPGSQAGMTIAQRGFLGHCPVGSICLSDSGISYVEDRLL